jgi:hypothetical protein
MDIDVTSSPYQNVNAITTLLIEIDPNITPCFMGFMLCGNSFPTSSGRLLYIQKHNFVKIYSITVHERLLDETILLITSGSKWMNGY